MKVEGEAGTWAVIKLNYFNSTGWLGVDDRVGVTTDDLDWKLFEKTDCDDKYPAATLIVPTCHIEGNGTAWFDDLEVIAYDRDKLPRELRRDARQEQPHEVKSGNTEAQRTQRFVLVPFLCALRASVFQNIFHKR